MNRYRIRQRQRGVVLVMAMIFSTMLAALAAGALQVATLEIRMAGNAAARMLALELADSTVVHILQQPASFPLSSEPGEQLCDSDELQGVCRAAFADAGQNVYPSVTRLAPPLQKGFPMRESESRVSGVGHFDTALFEVAVTVGSPDDRSGVAHVVQGVALRVPAVAD
jgi:sulfite reductase beta subunit-like hemoprotein